MAVIQNVYVRPGERAPARTTRVGLLSNVRKPRIRPSDVSMVLATCGVQQHQSSHGEWCGLYVRVIFSGDARGYEPLHIQVVKDIPLLQIIPYFTTEAV